jgi:uncharacterized protein
MRDDEFERDDGKAASNAAKHGITFDMAREAFRDPFIVEWIDHTQDAIEPRYSALAMIERRILFVAYAMRGDVIRIISARLAAAFERRRYHNENQA